MSIITDTTVPAANPAREEAARLYREALTASGVSGQVFRAAFERARIAAENARGSSLSYADLGGLAGLVGRSLNLTHANTTPADGVTVSAVALARITGVTSHLLALGVASGGEGSTTDGGAKIEGSELASGHFARGTRVREDGEARYEVLRAELHSQPTLTAFAAGATAAHRREDWRDIHAPLGYLDVTPGGALLARRADEGATDLVGVALWPTRESFRQLGGRLGFSNGVDYLWNTAPTHIRVDALAHHIDVSAGAPKADRKGRIVGTHAEDVLVLRSALSGRTDKDGTPVRVVPGIVTERYTSLDTPDLLSVITEALGADADDVHVEGHYALGKGSVTAFWMANTVVDLACEDIFKSGVSIAWDDRGLGSIVICGAFFRNLCLNLQLIDNATVEIARIAHFGTREALVVKVREGIATALAAIGPVLEAYGIARKTILAPVVVEATDDTPASVTPGIVATLTQWVMDGTLGLPRRSQADKDRAVAALLAAVVAEDAALGRPADFSEYTQADAVNAVTRAAHECAWINLDLRAEMERIATTLLPVAVRA